jgi:hypothetical protein
MARRVEFKLCRVAENASSTLRTLLADRKGAT